MLKRNWGILLTLGIAAVGSPLLYVALQPRQPNLPRYEYREAREERYQPGGRGCQPAILATIRDRREAARERERCAEEAEDHRLQSNDLVQQARAADAAQAQALLAHNMAWMGVYGTIGGFLTLLAAAAAAFYARDAARAGKDSLTHAQDVSETELRPWLQIEMTPEWARIWSEDIMIMCEVKVKNIGRTPARNVRIGSVGVVVPSIDSNFVSNLFDGQTNVNPSFSAILPGGEHVDYTIATVPWMKVGSDPRKPIIPFVGINVLYELPNGETGQTGRTFWVGFPGEEDPRVLRHIEDADGSGVELNELAALPSTYGEVR